MTDTVPALRPRPLWRRFVNPALVAAALLWRLFYSVLTLPLGAITLDLFRKANTDVLQHEGGDPSLGPSVPGIVGSAT